MNNGAPWISACPDNPALTGRWFTPCNLARGETRGDTGMRGRWLAVAGLTLMTVLIGAPQASAQTLPPEVTSNVTCETVPATGAKYVKLGASIKNPNTVAVTYTLVRTWS